MKQRLTFLWIFAGLILAVGATLAALPNGSSTAAAQAISTESPAGGESADLSTQAAIVRADPDPRCVYPDVCPPPVSTCDSTVTSEIVFSDPTFGDIVEEHTVAFENCDVNIVRTTLTLTDGSLTDLFEQKGRSSSEILFSLCTFGASAGVFTHIEPEGYLTFIASEAPGGPALPGGTVVVRSQATVADCAIAVDPFLVP